MEQIKLSKKNNDGFVALTAVILISAVIGLIIVSISVQTIDETQISLAFTKSKQAKYDAFSCAENILLELSNDSDYALTDSFEINIDGPDNIMCATTTLASYAEGWKTLRIETGDEFVSKLEIDIATTTPNIQIDSFNFVD